jgi:hypothetical protein
MRRGEARHRCPSPSPPSEAPGGGGRDVRVAILDQLGEGVRGAERVHRGRDSTERIRVVSSLLDPLDACVGTAEEARPDQWRTDPPEQGGDIGRQVVLADQGELDRLGGASEFLPARIAPNAVTGDPTAARSTVRTVGPAARRRRIADEPADPLAKTAHYPAAASPGSAFSPGERDEPEPGGPQATTVGRAAVRRPRRRS